MLTRRGASRPWLCAGAPLPLYQASQPAGEPRRSELWLDIDSLLPTTLASTEMSSVERLNALGITVRAWPSKHSVYFERGFKDR